MYSVCAFMIIDHKNIKVKTSPSRPIQFLFRKIIADSRRNQEHSERDHPNWREKKRSCSKCLDYNKSVYYKYTLLINRRLDNIAVLGSFSASEYQWVYDTKKFGVLRAAINILYVCRVCVCVQSNYLLIFIFRFVVRNWYLRLKKDKKKTNLLTERLLSENLLFFHRIRWCRS